MGTCLYEKCRSTNNRVKYLVLVVKELSRRPFPTNTISVVEPRSLMNTWKLRKRGGMYDPRPSRYIVKRASNVKLVGF